MENKVYWSKDLIGNLFIQNPYSTFNFLCVLHYIYMSSLFTQLVSDKTLKFVPADSCDVNEIISILLDANLPIHTEAYGEKVEEILRIQYEFNNPGTFIVKDEEKNIGIFKIHLPRSKVGKTISVSALFKKLGFTKGMRAILLMSNWDEYKLKVGETYIEYIGVRDEFKENGYEAAILNKCIQLATEHDSKYITVFSPENTNYNTILENVGFKKRRNVKSPIAKLYGVTSLWNRYRYTIENVSPTIKDAIYTLKRKYEYREARSALQLSLWLLVVPIVGGILAFIRNFNLAATFWALLFLFHVIGIIIVYNEKWNAGKYIISAVMIAEAGNMTLRIISTNNWYDRTWLLMLALLDLWIAFMILRISKHVDDKIIL